MVTLRVDSAVKDESKHVRRKCIELVVQKDMRQRESRLDAINSQFLFDFREAA